MISQKSIERLLSIVDIVDTISHYVDVRKMGANYKCVCPFHDDRNPSMSISPQRQIYHCFACKAGGNAIKFVMDYEKLSYPEAIEKLASMNNFTLEYTTNQQNFKENKRILESVNAFYRSRLYQNKDAINYLYSRGINDAMIERFELGFAPSSTQTIRLLENEKIEPKEAIEVGIVKQNESGIYASFIDRITFPIYSQSTRLVGFGGRTISNHPAKYVNSPQSEIFDKSKLLYGFHLAKKKIYETKQIIITEGYLDVIMLHFAGFTNAVAVLGTALTQKHLPLLKRENISVILCFDGDSAGINAAIKSSHLLTTNEIDGSVVIIEGGADPADMVFAGKIEHLRELFNNGTELGEFFIRQIALKYDLSRPQQKQKCLDEIMAYTNELKPIIASSYTSLIATILGLNPTGLSLNKTQITPRNFAPQEQIIKPKFSKDILELSLLKTILLNENFKDYVIDQVNEKFFLNHANIFSEILNGKNGDESAILRELELDNSPKIITNENSLFEAIKILKINYCKRRREQIKNSQSPTKLQDLEEINKILKGLQEQK